MKNKQSKNRNANAINLMQVAPSNKSIRKETVEMTESMAYDITIEFLAEQYKSGGYLGFMQSIAGLVQRYDAVLTEAEGLGQGENMCRAAGASVIALNFIPDFRAELARIEGRIN